MWELGAFLCVATIGGCLLKRFGRFVFFLGYMKNYVCVERFLLPNVCPLLSRRVVATSAAPNGLELLDAAQHDMTYLVDFSATRKAAFLYSEYHTPTEGHPVTRRNDRS